MLIFFLLKPLWKDRLSKQWQYYIWLIVVARLLLPYAPETNLVGTIFHQLETNMAQAEQVIPETQNVQTETEQTQMEGNHDNGTIEEKASVSSNPKIVQNTISFSIVILLAWLVVALILFVRKVTIYQGFVKYIKAGQEPVDNIDVLNDFGILLSETGIKKNIELVVNPLISSPLIMGFLRPCIVLPDIALADTDFCYTIRHELTHYRRHDMIYKWLVQVVICIHWFNPFVYLMGREINRACELSCDEAVICHMNIEEKVAYGDTLLNAMETRGNYKDSLASITLSESKTLLKERLDAIMNYRKKPKLFITIPTVLTIALCFGSAVLGAYATTSGLATEQIQNIENFAKQESVSSKTNTSNGYWRYFNYYYNDGILFGSGWRERDNINLYTTKTYITIDGVEYPVAFLDGAGELINNKKFNAAIKSSISELMEDGWKQDHASSGFWAVDPIYSGQNPNELFELVAEENELLALGTLMPYVKKETVEKYIKLYFEKDDTDSMLVMLNEASDYFKINIDNLAKRAIEDGNTDMYIILEHYISSDNASGYRKMAKDKFFPVSEVAELPTLPPLPALPPLPTEESANTDLTSSQLRKTNIKIDIDRLKQSEQVVYGPYNLKSGTKWRVDLDWEGNGMISVSCKKNTEYAGEQLIQQVTSPIVHDFIISESGEYLFTVLNRLAASEKYQLNPYVSNLKGNIYLGNNGNKTSKADSPSGSTNNVTNSTDAKALELMQNTGNWGYIEPYLPQMTNAGIDAVVDCYNSKHFNPNEYKKASDYYNAHSDVSETTSPNNSGSFDYSVLNRLDTMTSAEVDALALSYIASTGQFGHIYNMRYYMTTNGIDAAVEAYLNSNGDVGVVLAMLPYMSESEAKEVKEIALRAW